MVIKHIKLLLFNRSFLLGFLLSIALFAKYIFSTGNLYEDVKLVLSKELSARQQPDEKDGSSSIYKAWYKW